MPCYCVGQATAKAAREFGFKNVIVPDDPTGNAMILTAFLKDLKEQSQQEMTDRFSTDFSHSQSTELTELDSRFFTTTKPLLVLTCPQRLPTLTKRLKEFDITFEERFVYSSKPKHPKILTKELVSWYSQLDSQQRASVTFAFFSPSGVQAIDEVCDTYFETNIDNISNGRDDFFLFLRDAKKISIGETTDRAILERCQKYENDSLRQTIWRSDGKALTPTPNGLLNVFSSYTELNVCCNENSDASHS